MNQSEKQNISKVAKNSLISGVGSLANLITTPLTSLITTRVLGAELFGIYSLVQSWGALLSNISSLGLNGTNLRFIPTYKGLGDRAKIKGSILWTFRVSFTISLLITLFILFFPSLFCEFFIHRPLNVSEETFENNIVTAFRFYAVSILLTSVYLVMMSSLNGLQEIKYKIISNEIIGSASKILSLVLFIFFGWDLYAALGSNLIQDAVILSVSLYFLLKVFPEIKDTSFKPDFEKSRMNKFAAAVFSNSLLNKYSFQLDILFLGFFNSMRDVGIYTVALRLQPLIYLPHYTISAVFGPLVAELHASAKIEELKNLYKTVTKWSFTISLPIFATLVLFSDEVLKVFGKDFTEGKHLVVIMGVANVIHDLVGLSGSVIMMTGRIRINLYNSMVTAFINITCFPVLIYLFGISGAAWAYFVSVIVMDIILASEMVYIFKFNPFKKSLYKPILAISAAMIVTYITKLIIDWQSPLALILVLVLLSSYGILLYLFKIDEEDRMVINKIKQKTWLRKVFK